MVFHYFFTDELATLFYGTEGSIFLVLLLIGIFVVTLPIINSILPFLKGFCVSQQTMRQLNVAATLLIILFVIASAYFYFNHGIHFRHQERLRNAGILVKLLFFLNFFAKYYVFVMLVKYVKGLEFNRLNKLNLLMILIGSILSLNASMTIIFIFLIAVLLIFPKLFILKINFFQMLFLGFILLFLGIAVVFMGHANKVGIAKALIIFTDWEMIEYVFVHLIKRVSTSYMSLQNMLCNYPFDLELQLKTFSSSFESFMQRLNVVIPLYEAPQEEIVSVNRTNFLLLYIPYNNHAGTSPGLLASIFYLPFFGFFLIALYTLAVIRSINRYFYDQHHHLNIIGTLMVFFFALSLFESPLNMLTIINPVVLYFVLFYVGSYVKIPQKGSYVQKNCQI